MATNKKLLRNAHPIPDVCPYPGFKPDTRSGQVSETVAIPPCGKATISGPFYIVKRKPAQRSDDGIVTRTYFCRTCHRDWADDYAVNRKVDVLLLDRLGIKL